MEGNFQEVEIGTGTDELRVVGLGLSPLLSLKHSQPQESAQEGWKRVSGETLDIENGRTEQ